MRVILRVILLANWCDKNVIAPYSDWVKTDQDGSEPAPGKRLKNHVE